MPGMASEGESVGESWFALKKDEFYVILDSVLTEMTKCEERNSVSGCIELIKLLSDNETTSTACDKIPSREGSGNTRQLDRLTSNQSVSYSSGCTGYSKDDTNAKLPSCYKTPVNFRSTGRQRFGDNNAQLGIRSGVDCRRHLNKGNLPSATCVARRPGNHRDKAASKLPRPGVVFSREVGYGRKTGLNGKTRDAKTSLFHPNRVGTNHGHHDIYFNSKRRNDQVNGFNAKLSTVPGPGHQRQLARGQEMRLQSKSRIPCSGPYDDTRVSSNRPATDYHRHQSSFNRNPEERSIRPTSVSNATEVETFGSEANRVARHITDPELQSTVDRKLFLTTKPRAPNSKWTPVDKTVINNILDDILSCDESHSPVQTVLQSSHNNNDVDIRNDDATRTADGFLLQNDIKVENLSDVTTNDTRNANMGNNGVISNVKLVDVRHFDVSQMSFKWKSQLLWRMRHDKVPQTPLSSLCLT